MQAQNTERKYALTRVAKGDYILPDNDGQKIWRVRVYEDGPSHGLEDWPRDVTLWGVWEYTGRSLEVLDPDNSDQWVLRADGFATCAEAIREALSHEHAFGPWEDDPAGVVRSCECGHVDFRPEG